MYSPSLNETQNLKDNYKKEISLNQTNNKKEIHLAEEESPSFFFNSNQEAIYSKTNLPQNSELNIN